MLKVKKTFMALNAKETMTLLTISMTKILMAVLIMKTKIITKNYDDDDDDDDDDIYNDEVLYVCMLRFCLFCLPPAKLTIYI